MISKILLIFSCLWLLGWILNIGFDWAMLRVTDSVVNNKYYIQTNITYKQTNSITNYKFILNDGF